MLPIVARSASDIVDTPGAEELDELADDFLLAEDFGHGEHEVGGRRAGAELAREFHADDFRQQHVDRLPEHHAFGLDAADAPTDDAQAVDHRGVAIGADERIGERDRAGVVLAEEHDLGQVFEIHLVDDAGARRHDAEIVERLLAPAEEFVPLAVAGEFHVDVEVERVGRVEVVDLHRVVDDEVDRHERIDFLRVAAEPLHRGPHRGEVDHAGHAGEILQHDAGRLEGDFDLGRRFGLPRGQGLHVVLGDHVAVAVAEQRFQQHADRVGQGGDVAQAGVLELRKAVDAGGAAAGLEGVAGGKGIGLQLDGTHAGVLDNDWQMAGWRIVVSPRRSAWLADQPTHVGRFYRENRRFGRRQLGQVAAGKSWQNSHPRVLRSEFFTRPDENLDATAHLA